MVEIKSKKKNPAKLVMFSIYCVRQKNDLQKKKKAKRPDSSVSKHLVCFRCFHAAHMLPFMPRLSGVFAEIIWGELVNELNVTKRSVGDLTNSDRKCCLRSCRCSLLSRSWFNPPKAQSDWRRPFLLRSVSQLSIISPKRHLAAGKKKTWFSVVVPEETGGQ